MERYKDAAGLRTAQAHVAAWAGTGCVLVSCFQGVCHPRKGFVKAKEEPWVARVSSHSLGYTLAAAASPAHAMVMCHDVDGQCQEGVHC